uniref:Complexin n=1 Tax=Aceria tosichella TaxID=561515 RepID=A0A6G1S9H9_9ACAR
MAAFIAKQMVGNQFSAVKADIGGNEGPSAEERAKLEEEERERLLALQEAEEARKEKHRKLEAEREKMRQGVREKYNIKKKDDQEDEIRRQQEAEMAAHIAAMNPRNPENKKPINLGAGPADEEDFATKLMNGNVSGAAACVASKMQSILPQNFPFFKKE